MKLHPRLIASAVRSLFGRFSFAPGHTLAPRALADGPQYAARDLDKSLLAYSPLKIPSLAQPLLFWVIGAGLAGIYFIWFFSDLLPHIIR